jgi:hypothetical protein
MFKNLLAQATPIYSIAPRGAADPPLSTRVLVASKISAQKGRKAARAY